LFHIHRCTLCDYRFNPLADISCGDAWLPDYLDDRLGTSVIVARNKKAKNILEDACRKGYIRLYRRKNIIDVRSIQKYIRSLQTRVHLQKVLKKPVPAGSETLFSMSRDLGPFSISEIFSQFSFNAMRAVAYRRGLWVLLDLNLMIKKALKRARSAHATLKIQSH
jgi:hypothetical protein